jgi:hypothetical protein
MTRTEFLIEMLQHPNNAVPFSMIRRESKACGIEIRRVPKGLGIIVRGVGPDRTWQLPEPDPYADLM